jgi:hypothetical protein
MISDTPAKSVAARPAQKNGRNIRVHTAKICRRKHVKFMRQRFVKPLVRLGKRTRLPGSLVLRRRSGQRLFERILRGLRIIYRRLADGRLIRIRSEILRRGETLCLFSRIFRSRCRVGGRSKNRRRQTLFAVVEKFQQRRNFPRLDPTQISAFDHILRKQ